MRQVVAAVIERADRRLLIGQRRREDSSPLKWEFPGGKVREGEELEAALARELKEELGRRTSGKHVRAGEVGPAERTGRVRFPCGEPHTHRASGHRKNQAGRNSAGLAR